jgi:hypothetical protein
MAPLHDDVGLAMYERGVARHAIDRALLLATAIGDGVDWADEPLGRRDARLVELQCEWFGSRFDAVAVCPACRALLSCSIDLREIARCANVPDDVVRTVHGRFRAPTSRDLAAIAGVGDVARAAHELLERLALDEVPPGGWTSDGVAAIERALEAADPLAYVTITVHCDGCDHDAEVPLDIGASLWDELALQARETIEHVHLLAGAYGWSEREVLGLSPSRRRLYLERVQS